MKIILVNLEEKMPTVDQARIRLDQSLRNARSQKQKVIKIIHGYGSTGKGGAIKKDVQFYLKEQKANKRILAFVGGEDFSPFSPEAREILSYHPELSKDSDYSRSNQGITLVVMNK